MLFIYFSLCKFTNYLVHFWKRKSVFLQILHQSLVPSNITLLYFFQLEPYIVWSKDPMKEQVIYNFECSSQNSSNSSCQFWNDKSIRLQILHHFSIVMRHNSTVNFSLIHFLLWTKGSHQSSNSDTFNCSGENLPNSSCHFPNHKSVFLQILHHSSVSWKITSLYFF